VTVRLRDVLTPRALAAWAGTDRLSALAFRLPAAAPHTLAAKLFALFVAGDSVEGVSLGEWRGLVESIDGKLRSKWSVLPLGSSLLVCDRLDAERGLATVSWPDDSSYHLALSIPPGRCERWLDIGTGSAFAPLLRPELAATILGTDLNAHAVTLARIGRTISELPHISVETADLAAGVDGTFELVTCNAPIPADVGPLWRSTADMTLFDRLFAEVPRVLAPGGTFVLHAALDQVSTIVEALPGERVTVSYVPEGGRQFGIVWWRPHAQDRHVVGRRALTDAQPHLTHHDRSLALGA
jgi:SAM-dependent methyltransferase